MRLLITTIRLAGLTGSEVTALELAEEASRQGHSPAIYTLSVSPALARELDRSGVRVLTPESGGAWSEWDAVWVRHGVVPPQVLDRVPGQPPKLAWVFEHLSPFAAQESAFLADIENRLASVVLANSEETKAALEAHGIDAGVEVFDNPAPREFVRFPATSASELSKVLVVSNHLPTEAARAIELLERMGIKVTRLGMQFGNSRRVAPRDIVGHDAVITIGKTVQYSIVSGRPAYIYDQFGGPGYLLSRGDYEWFGWYNYSGRGAVDSRKQPKEIVEALVGTFPEANSALAEWREENLGRYCLEPRLRTVLERVEVAPRPTVSDGDAHRLRSVHNLLVRYERLANEAGYRRLGRSLVDSARTRGQRLKYRLRG